MAIPQKDDARPASELTLRALLLGLLLSAGLSAANAYLGLFAGMTVSASIPAAVVSMGLLRAFRGTILENNLVQTAASAGEAAAAGAIFTLPAMILIGAWHQFPYGICALLVFLGGLLGVVFTIFLRHELVVRGSLPYPEGVATAQVLRAGHDTSGSPETSRGLRYLVWGGALGAGTKILESGFGWSKAVVEGAFATPVGTFYAGTGTAPALVAVGHIVGLRAALFIFIGGLLNWVCVLPFVTEVENDASAIEAVWTAWSQKTRYLGVGAMTVGGLGALLSVRLTILEALRASFSFRKGAADRRSGISAELATNASFTTPLSQRDLPPRLLGYVTLACTFPLSWVFRELSGSLWLGVAITGLVLGFGFLFSCVAAYMAGLLGSSNNPVSGVTIATVVLISLLLSGLDIEAASLHVTGAAGPAAALLVGTIVCTAAAIGGDNLQDLKAGHILGATPYRQQIMQVLGVVAAAMVLGPVLQLLLDAYGFGPRTAAQPQALRAPQATLMASVTEGVFGGKLPWTYVALGAVIAFVLVLVDEVQRLRKSAFRAPPLAVALGLYLPWEMSVPVLLGAWFGRKGGKSTHMGLLGAAGLITGEALMGILLAIRVALFQEHPLKTRIESPLLALLLLLGCVGFLRRAGTSAGSRQNVVG